MQRAPMHASSLFSLLESNHPMIGQLRETMIESRVCPLNMKHLNSDTDKYLVIKDMPVIYRISKDYTKFLLQTSKATEIVNSILNVPWLCLQRSERCFIGMKKQGNSFKTESPYPFLSLGQRGNDRKAFNLTPLEYFLEIEIAHPISDKVYYYVAYSSELNQSDPPSRNPQVRELCDVINIGEARKSFIDRKEILIPDVTFIMHLKLTIPALKRVKQSKCIVYSLHEQTYNQSFAKPGSGEYNVTLEMDDECLLTLGFNSFFINTQTETGMAALTSLYPRESRQLLDSLNLRRLVLSYTKCEFLLFENEARNLALSDIYSDIYHDMNDENYKQAQAYIGEKHKSSDDAQDCTSDHYSKQQPSNSAMQVTKSKSSRKESDQQLQSDEVLDDFPEECKGSKENSAENSFVMAPQGKHSFDQILKEPLLLKLYAGPSQKAALVQEVISAMSEEDYNNSFSFLKHSFREVCKSKYGNYIIQIFVQNLANERMLELLVLMKPHIVEVICHPKGTFAIQGIIAALTVKDHQKAFLDMVLPDLNTLTKNKEGSYIIKEIYRHFDQDLLQEVTQVFMQDLSNNISDKYAICIFKEIASMHASKPNQLDQLLITFSSQYQTLKTNTFYHFGLQYLLEVYHSQGRQCPMLSAVLLDFAKNYKNLFRSRSTADTVLLSFKKPPTEAYRRSLLEIIGRRSYLKNLAVCTTGPQFLDSLILLLTPQEKALLSFNC